MKKDFEHLWYTIAEGNLESTFEKGDEARSILMNQSDMSVLVTDCGLSVSFSQDLLDESDMQGAFLEFEAQKINSFHHAIRIQASRIWRTEESERIIAGRISAISLSTWTWIKQLQVMHERSRVRAQKRMRDNGILRRHYNEMIPTHRDQADMDMRFSRIFGYGQKLMLEAGYETQDDEIRQITFKASMLCRNILEHYRTMRLSRNDTAASLEEQKLFLFPESGKR